MNVFTYGSLMFVEVWSAVVKGRYDNSIGEVKGLVRRRVKNETYPAVIRAAKHNILQGRVYFDVSQMDVKRLDEFEGEYYRREMIKVSLDDGASVKAAVYLLKNEYLDLLDKQEWDVRWFESEGLEIFLKAYKGFL